MNTGANDKAATLRDVASRAGVSLATASCALGQGRRGVSEEMRARVQRAADE
ncbi:MAG: LacI family DNA-binding transcriptional regulator, partial [Actinobacteria bacterium]|nr:LacI family DNA-binding transcriptional regulator [Actinomycetota bacterium]